MKQKPSIVIVEDSRLVAEKMKNLLKESVGIEDVDIARNFQQGLRYVQYLQPALVLLDIQLPDGNGLELLRIINREFPDIRVIVVSNHSNDSYRNLASLWARNTFLTNQMNLKKYLTMSETNFNPNVKNRNLISVIVNKFIKGFFPGMTTLENQPVVAKPIIKLPVPKDERYKVKG